jgi:SDR family mycofactocin-dependent oxidoreductase
MEAELAIVTGAARGIGAAAAEAFAREGRPLVLIDACVSQPGITYDMPSLMDFAAVGKRCRQAGSPAVELVRADVGAPSLGALVTAAVAGRRVSAAVAAAGLIVGAPGWATEEQAWETLLAVNLHGARRLAEATIPQMLEAGRGHFVAVASSAALRAMPQLAAYSAAKAAVAAYVRALAADLAGTGVTANAICPGSTRGAMLAASAKVYDLESQDTFAVQQLLHRLLEPAEIAEVIAWLCGPHASAMTGAILPVDGGLTA